MAEADKDSIGELKSRTIEKLESMGYYVTEHDCIITNVQEIGYWIGNVLINEKVEINYYDTPDLIFSQIKLRDDARGKGLEVIESNREDILRFVNEKFSEWNGLLAKI